MMSRPPPSPAMHPSPLLHPAEWRNRMPPSDSSSSPYQDRVMRSSPIAIIRNVEDTCSDSDDSVIDVELDAIKLERRRHSKKHHQSLPTSLLRAPFLGSSVSRHRPRIPPPMILSESVEDQAVSYGSLRESNMLYNKRLQATSVAATLPNQISIHDRLSQSRKNKTIPKQEGTSSLTAMMEASDKVCPPEPEEEKQQHEEEAPLYHLSSSLTGLEVLIAARKTAEQHRVPVVTDPFRGNGLMSRSLSDPMPQHQRSPYMANAPVAASPTWQQNAAVQQQGPPLFQLDTAETSKPPPMSIPSSEQPPQHYHSSFAMERPPIAPTHPVSYLPEERQANALEPHMWAPRDEPHNSESNPDTEAAFDLDME